MSQITDVLNYEIYPALYSRIETVLPEFGFKPSRGGYVSTTDHKITGDAGKKGKVYLYANNISHLKDYTRGSVSIWDYIQTRDNLSNRETLEKLADLSGVILPPLDEEAQERIKKAVTRAQIWEDANSYFIYCLNSESKTAQKVRTYLTGRGYTQEDITALELGYIPSQDQLYKYLTETKKHNKETVEKTIELNSGIGSSHLLTIPYREPVGRIKGIVARSIKPDTEPKYFYSTGLKRDEFLFNLRAVKGDKDLVIVEGLLDSLIATARGIDNVVALGGSSLNKTQIGTALKYGAQMFTLCLDNDTAGEEATLRALNLLRDQDLRVYIGLLPEGIKDPDQLIKEQGVEALKGIIAQALPYWKYYIQTLHKKYKDLAEKKDFILTEKEKDNLLEEVVTYSQTINSPVDREQYTKVFTSIDWVQTIGITPESLLDTVEKLRYKRDKEKQGERLNKLLKEAKDLHKIGEVDLALNKLREEGREIEGIDKKQNYERLLQIPREEEVKKIIQGEAESIETGYTLRDQLGDKLELRFPSGALSIVSGRTSHRKTGLMLNIALNTAQKYPDKEIHFLSYEESQEALIIKLLNIYINKDFKKGTNNLRYIKGYFKTGGDTYTNPEFLTGKERFFNELFYPGRLRINYSPLMIDNLTGAIEYLASKGNVGAVFIDYIQLLRIGGTFQSRQLQLQDICERLRETAIKTRLPIILGAQFNREVQMEGDLDPGKIREAGDIEQTANLVLGLWDRAFTKENQGAGKEHKDRRGETARYEPGTLYIEVLKGRDIGVGAYGELRYYGNTGKIENKPQGPGF